MISFISSKVLLVVARRQLRNTSPSSWGTSILLDVTHNPRNEKCNVSNRYDEVVTVHVDDQMDGKSLIGSYVCTDTPGEFKWQPGALSIAVMAGKLVLLEDIDKAPPDVLATLIPLLEHRKLPGKNLQHASAHSSFKFVATRCVRSSAVGAPRRVPPIVQAVRGRPHVLQP